MRVCYTCIFFINDHNEIKSAAIIGPKTNPDIPNKLIPPMVVSNTR